MATRFSTLAWRIPWTEKPGGLQSMGCRELNMTERLILSLGSLPRPIPRTEALTVSALGRLAPLLASTLVRLRCTVAAALLSPASDR